MPLETGARPTEVSALAGDGGRYAVVAYGAPAGTAAGGRAAAGPCRLALIDLLAGSVVRAHQACAPGDAVAGLALRAGDAGPVAYLATWRPGSGPADRGRGRVVALDATTGAPLAAYDAGGLPVDLVLGRAPPGQPGPPATAERLYAVVGRPAGPPGEADGDQEFDTAEGWWLVGLDPEGLAVASDRAVAGPLRRLAVAPDGRQAYAFAPAGDPALGSALVAVDLATGATANLGKRVPGQGLAGLAVTDERVYVPLPDGAEVWVGDRQGRPLGVVPVGRRPFAIALGRRRHVSSRSRALAATSRRASRSGSRGTGQRRPGAWSAVPSRPTRPSSPREGSTGGTRRRVARRLAAGRHRLAATPGAQTAPGSAPGTAKAPPSRGALLSGIPGGDSNPRPCGS